MKVLDLIRNRKREGSLPGERTDGKRLALVIEGGGMRGVVTGGMAAALERMGLTSCFDAVFGASAGAMAGAFLVAGNASKGVAVYYDHINNRRFINVFRLLAGRGAMDLDFLVHDVFVNGVPLECDRIIASRIPLNVVATDVSDGSVAVLRDFGSAFEVREALKASACNPLGGGAPVEIGGHPYWDAFLAESIPLGVALDRGYDHALILRSRADGIVRSSPGLAERTFAKVMIARHSQDLYRRFCDRADLYREELARIESAADQAVQIFPAIPPGIGQITTNRLRLFKAAQSGYEGVLKAFGVEAKFVGNALDSY